MKELKIYNIHMKPCGSFGCINAKSPKDAIKKYLEVNDFAEDEIYRLKASKENNEYIINNYTTEYSLLNNEDKEYFILN